MYTPSQHASLSGRNSNDIAMLIMNAGFRLNKNVQVALLPTTDEYCPIGESLIVSGWGSERISNISFITRKHQYLWAAKQKCVDTDKCTNNHTLAQQMICAEGQKEIRDSACPGDSGGNF